MRRTVMLIAHISDSHISHGGRFDEERLAALGACVDHINQLDPRPELVVHTGDVVHEGAETEYRLAAAQLARLDVDLRVIPGNKDHRTRLQDSFPTACSLLAGSPYLQHAVDLDQARLIFLDTTSERSNKGTLCEIRLAHLDRTLRDADKPVLLFMHHPPFEVPSAPEPFQFESRRAVARLADILAKHAPLAGMFAGHMHRHFATDWAGVSALAATACAIDLRKGAGLGSLQDRPCHCLHRFSPEEGISTLIERAVPADREHSAGRR